MERLIYTQKARLHGINVVRLRIEELLEQRGISAYRLALDTGIGHTALWKLRHGKQPSIRLEYIGRLCAALECSPGDLIEIDESTPAAKETNRGATGGRRGPGRKRVR